MFLCAIVALWWTVPVSAAETVHLVTPGEGLSSIAEKYNISMAELIDYNGITDPNTIFIGQQLGIPRSFAIANAMPAEPGQLPAEGGYYVVARGDSLSRIASHHDVDLADLMRLNGLTDSNFIWVGQTLRVTARVEPVLYDEAPEPQLANEIYLVRDGDTLSEIARNYVTTVEQLLVANGLPGENF
ncbi:MAG: LysM peptidoglycan-binding domain-containing protein, partial [Caldilineaceae bacterium]|nr:LysM peptidoglycan-binding domain-containing protein [Caldilineaceae bacterium]